LWATIPAALALTLAVASRQGPALSPYKWLPQLLAMPGTRVIHQTQGPLGRLDVVTGPAVRYAPGLGLQWHKALPPHALILLDGDQPSGVYRCERPDDWAFMDHTTGAAAYHVGAGPSVCIVGAGGGAEIGLALHHSARPVVALEMNPQVIAAMTAPLADRGGSIYNNPAVRVLNREARGFFATGGQRFDVIQVPALDAFGATGAGLHAAHEAYLYTVESFRAMLRRLRQDGVLSVTRWADVPPRDGLRAFDLAACALRAEGLDPAPRMAMLRNWATVTVLAFRAPIDGRREQALRRFCDQRGFDLCYLPGLDSPPAEPFHALPRPYYFEAAKALLSDRRGEFLKDYLFRIDAPTDDRPYFFHNFRWRQLRVLPERIGRAGRAFVERGYLMLIAALIQALVLAAVLIPAPLVCGMGAPRQIAGKAPTLAFFALLGAGFMLLEMGFLQKLILYLAHPIYSAAAVIASFLVFAGIGSGLTHGWKAGPRRIIFVAGLATAALAALYGLALDTWLGWTLGWSLGPRLLLAAATIAPLALAMGHLVPSALRLMGGGDCPLVPWAWAVNGFASVAATAAAPLLAMSLGFSRVLLAGVACYVLASILSLRLPAAR